MYFIYVFQRKKKDIFNMHFLWKEEAYKIHLIGYLYTQIKKMSSKEINFLLAMFFFQKHRRLQALCRIIVAV
ncbi:hypothetical protein IB75_04490 [Nitrosococcus oceani C-27]|uniref:Uncharacterized protein n=1 Tax=Nitrosococcus oceani C-27 TaxID=314279 RepID=A0A0E2Z3F4_9GAMM|nr:hypothetical protein IB75_04490 [Nitrosococcus oceani C-27]